MTTFVNKNTLQTPHFLLHALACYAHNVIFGRMLRGTNTSLLQQFGPTVQRENRKEKMY